MVNPPAAQETAPAAVLDRDTLIVRQVALKAAVEALGLYPPQEVAQKEWEAKVAYLGSYFEDWVTR